MYNWRGKILLAKTPSYDPYVEGFGAYEPHMFQTNMFKVRIFMQ